MGHLSRGATNRCAAVCVCCWLFVREPGPLTLLHRCRIKRLVLRWTRFGIGSRTGRVLCPRVERRRVLGRSAACRSGSDDPVHRRQLIRSRIALAAKRHRVGLSRDRRTFERHLDRSWHALVHLVRRHLHRPIGSRLRIPAHAALLQRRRARTCSLSTVKGILDLQRMGTLKPKAPVLISTNRFDSFAPWMLSRQLALDWCGHGSDVQLWTNDQPPLLNKLSINHLLPYFVDGERNM